ncbi:MAG TPA: sugar phosphate nucleotidyltransferase [Kofleriaceae bacterium]|nr:sugar phosphate nucleotidyltransferase [Kofleriaceae bacterium]
MRHVRHAVILAGGSGTRLWPASRRARPKQLLALTDAGEPMVTAATRTGRALAGERVLIVTAESQAAATRAAAPGVELLVEPVGRNTAAAIGLAAAVLVARDPDAVLAVLPADQHVRDRDGFVRVLDAALTAAEQSDAIATVGIKPTRPETGFGYLEIDPSPSPSPRPVPVLRFVEKPDHATAERYVASGRYLWNAGIFCARASRLLAELDAHLPATGRAVRAIAADPAQAAALYPTLPSISIDHAVMEKASGVVTIPADVGWDDVGSWAALPAVRGVDATGNTVVGATLVLDGTGNVVISDDATLIATVGVSDLVVVKSGDAILVIRKDRAQDVRKVIDALSARGLARYL